MNVKITNNDSSKKFAFEDLTIEEMEIFVAALVMYKHKLDAEEFKDVRNSCIDMFHRIDAELIAARS